MTANPADIVERLTGHANAAAATLSANSMMPPEMSGLGDLEAETLIELCREAASLIEAQQAEIARLRRIAQARKEHGRELQAENAGMREALETIGRVELSWPSDAREIARAALKETKDA